MGELPIIELRIRDLGHQIQGAVMLHHEEIQAAVKEGVDRAADTIASSIVTQACEDAKKKFSQAVSNYFSYGPGAKVIEAAVQQALEPFLMALTNPPKKK